MRSYLPGGSRCAGSSAPGRVSSSWEPRRAAPPFLRTPETNPESAGETFRRLFLSPLLRSSSPLLFSPPPPQPLPPPSCTPPPGCRRAPSRSCAGGVRWGRRWGGEVATRKFKQTNTPTPSPPPPAWPGQKLSRVTLAATGPAGRAPCPQLRLAGHSLPRAQPKFPSREATEWISLGLYLYIYSLARAPSSPGSLLSTPLSARPHTLSPGGLERGRASARVSGWRGGDPSDRAGGEKRKSEGARAISWVSCAKVLNRRGGEGAGDSQRDLIGSGFSFIHEERRGPVREGEGTAHEKKSPTNIFSLPF